MQKGEVLETYADISLAQKDLNFKPYIVIEEGLENFVNWFKEYHY